MSVLIESFAAARRVLEVPTDADKAAIKRAYRRKTLEHPPDQDPEGFQLVRESYEALMHPVAAARPRLLHTLPHIAPPHVPEPEPPREPLVLGILRQVVASLPSEVVESHRAARKPRKTKPK